MDDHLVLHEVDGDGRIVAIVLFDLEDLDAAYAELDARFEAGEATAHWPSWQSMRGFLRATARLFGDIKAGGLVVENGAILVGAARIGKA
jgi:hypothetical protein